MPKLHLVDVKAFTVGLKQITTTSILSSDGVSPDHEGLLSHEIFGPVGSPQRRTTYAYISLFKNRVIHPAVYNILYRLDQKIEDIISGNKKFSVDPKTFYMVEDDNGSTGIDYLYQIFPRLQFRQDTTDRKRLVELVKSFKIDDIFLDRILVIPAGLRDYYPDQKTGSVRYDPINDNYKTIISVVKQVERTKTLSNSLKYQIQYKLQLSVIELYDYIKKQITKKEGLIRKSILGKRVDFSSRAVITVDPKLKFGQLGVPEKIAATLFEPFFLYVVLHEKDKETNRPYIDVFSELLNKKLHSTDIKDILKDFYDDRKQTVVFSNPKVKSLVREVLQKAIDGKTVIAKRDPVLHRLSVQAFDPVLVEDNSFHVHPLVVVPFNADFDGDTFIVYVPFTLEAQKEAREKLHVTKALFGISHIKEMPFTPSKDMVVGLYLLTKDDPKGKDQFDVHNYDEAFEKLKDHPYDTSVKFIFENRSTTTSLGRAVISYIHPDPMSNVLKKPMNKQVLKDFIHSITITDEQNLADRLQKLADSGFFGYTKAPRTIDLEDLTIADEFSNMRNDLKKVDMDKGLDLVNTETQRAMDRLKEDGSAVYDIVQSKAKPSKDDVQQILVTKGYVYDAEANILPEPASNSLGSGFTEQDYFNSAYGGRKGIIDRVLNTAVPGYLTRKIVYAASTAVLSKLIQDCGTTRTIKFKVTKDNYRQILGRYYVKGSKYVGIGSEDYAKSLVGTLINLRSPCMCSSKSICLTCYGLLSKRVRTDKIGILAAQSIGEPGTQMIMKTFHTGGIVTKKEKQVSLIDELFLKEEEFYVAKVDTTIIINSYANLKANELVIIGTDYIQLESGPATFKISNRSIDHSFDTTVKFYIPDGSYKIENDSIVISYRAKDQMFQVIHNADSVFSNQMKFVDSLFEMRQPITTVEKFLEKILPLYSSVPVDSVHFETVLSNMVRSEKNPYVPYRLSKDTKYIIYGILKVPSHVSWAMQMNFGYVDKAINAGLMGVEPEGSYLENMLFSKYQPSEYEGREMDNMPKKKVSETDQTIEETRSRIWENDDDYEMSDLYEDVYETHGRTNEPAGGIDADTVQSMDLDGKKAETSIWPDDEEDDEE